MSDPVVYGPYAGPVSALLSLFLYPPLLTNQHQAIFGTGPAQISAHGAYRGREGGGGAAVGGGAEEQHGYAMPLHIPTRTVNVYHV